MADGFYTDSEGSDDEALTLALAKLIRLSASGGTAGLCIRDKAILQGPSVFDTVLGGKVVADLFKKGVAACDGVTVALVLPAQSSTFVSGPFLAVYVDPSDVATLRASGQDVVYVPWTSAELATVLGGGQVWKKL